MQVYLGTCPGPKTTASFLIRAKTQKAALKVLKKAIKFKNQEKRLQFGGCFSFFDEDEARVVKIKKKECCVVIEDGE